MGVGLGGFVDGILLHQILQWHHMLTGEAGGEAMASPAWRRTRLDSRRPCARTRAGSTGG
jgi:hypothetical protein